MRFVTCFFVASLVACAPEPRYSQAPTSSEAAPPPRAEASSNAAPAASDAPTGKIPVVPIPEDCAANGAPGPFDRGCAAKTLSEAEIAARRACGPVPGGGGHIKVTFANTGRVDTAVVDSTGLAGTATAACIEDQFRHAHVPPFRAEKPISVGKTVH
jgi:hypothetical protein